ncbi:MAG: HemK/PrmC family methyltransferase, partial [Gammaproteobacteria bacterium]|nr:HemK/PrmC family methyltransferase [Gammaproteobacteria bacterium]
MSVITPLGRQSATQPAVRELLRDAAARLAPRHELSRLDAEVLLAHVLDVPRTRLHARPETVVDAERAERYRELITRRAAGEPVAHLTGRREFWSLDLEVSRETLIPRPETELLVEVALACIPVGESCRVADLGTGCVAIAIAIASERERSKVIATDISEAALEAAARNVARLVPGDVELRHGDWCEALDGP